MRIFNLMFGAAYSVYSKSENFDAKLRAISVLVLFQFGIIFFLAIRFNPIKDSEELHNMKSVVIPLVCALILSLFCINYIYYNRARASEIIQKFNELNDRKQKLAKLFTFSIFLLPIILSFFYQR